MNVKQLITSLDTMKNEVRLIIDSLTKQEFQVFTAIYQLQNEQIPIDYSVLASKLGLTEISIRDYTHKLIKKGVPLHKIKENNKKVYLEISSDFRKITNLPSILSYKSSISNS